MSQPSPFTPLRLDQLELWLETATDHEVTQGLRRLAPADRVVAFRLLSRERALAVFESLHPAQQQQILDGLREVSFRQLMEDLDPDDRARLLGEAPAKVVARVLRDLSPSEREYTAALLGYPDESAGRVMTPEIVSVRASSSAEAALDRVRRSAVEEEVLFVLPVTDDERRLVGGVALSTLLRASPEASVASLMSTELNSVGAMEDREVAARLIADAHLAALPVLDSEHRLVGMITADDAMWILGEEEAEDRQKIGGALPLRRPYLDASLLQLAHSRATWLLILGLSAAMSVNILDYFSGEIESIAVLILFVPLLIDTGGNTGAQATTVVIRAMATSELRFSDLPRVVWREARVGLMLGSMLAVVGFPLVALFYSADLAAVVSLTLIAICTWATLAGSMLPMVVDRLGMDPAVVSAPLITTLVDATGLLIYFGVARLLLEI